MTGIVIIFLVAIALGILGWTLEKRAWNDGICKESGKPWESFAVDSGGAVGYSDGEGHSIWISWPGVIKHKTKEKENDKEI